ncbi:hypothetical protein Dred_0934 [Desulforamulus reducens MI-1]|uniref:Uncharacterized protein n=1 Tax=Desulforamulus reducens (strain ATCC BAA-1160 / DSM 100696 / MI-1) TaxID=349161 RepID=A4J317_DESRM|nr:hypothetical protein [Desulforamulus reducens]ABO49470.1 hypothetical protein Dred_0934 [Desulforamulus reducens MI-1]
MGKKQKIKILLFLLTSILCITSTAWAETDTIEDGTGGSITVWQTFFMLLTVIPVSKMLSSIFMKLVARVGTVDEDKWAMVGLGAIGATVGLMKKGGIGMLSRGMSGGYPPSGSGGYATPGSFNLNGSGGNPGQTSINNTTDASQASAMSPGIPGVTLTPMGGGGSATGNTARTGSPLNNISAGGTPEVGQRSLNDILNVSGQTSSKAAGVMAKVGAASAFPVPGVAPVTAGIYAGTTKGVVGGLSTLNNLRKEVSARNEQNKMGFAHNLKAITGTNNMVAATTKTASALALSPLGSRVSTFGTGMLDKGFQKTSNIVEKTRKK